MNVRRPMALFLASIAAILVTAPVALATPTAQLAEASGAAFPAKRFVLTLPVRRAVRPEDVRVRENGGPVDGLHVVPASARTSAVIVAIDTSRSMRGAPIAAAMAAARRFAAGRPAGQRLGVVFFNRQAKLALKPTTDASRINQVLAAPPALATGTRIYDATAMAVRLLGQTQASLRSVVVLSDGADAGSRRTPAEVVEAARRTQTRVFGFGLRSGSYDGSALTHLAQLTGGRYADSRRRELMQLFAALSRRFDREFVVSYRSLAPAAARVGVRMQVAGILRSGDRGLHRACIAHGRARETRLATDQSFHGRPLGRGCARCGAGWCGGVSCRALGPSHRRRPDRGLHDRRIGGRGDARAAQGIAAEAERSARPGAHRRGDGQRSPRTST